jgi:hypothetical protein
MAMAMGVCPKQVFQPVGLMSSSAAKEAWSWGGGKRKKSSRPTVSFF